MHLKIKKTRRPPSDKQFIPVRHPGWNHHLHTMSGLYSLNGRNSNGGWFHSECFIQEVSVVWVNIFANPWSKALLNWQMRSIFTGSSQGLCIFITVDQSPFNSPTRHHILVPTLWAIFGIRFFFGDGIGIWNILNKQPERFGFLRVIQDFFHGEPTSTGCKNARFRNHQHGEPSPKKAWNLEFYCQLVVSTQLKNMLVKLDHLPR